MSLNELERIRSEVERIYREHSRGILATLIRLVGDFDLAEDALHEAFRAAVESWPEAGIPANPRSWLISTGRFKAIDQIRRRQRLRDKEQEVADRMEQPATAFGPVDEEPVEDDQLRLIFTCGHPALPPEGRVALTLREVCGLATEEIARAFLVSPATLAQRIVRAKARIRDKGIPFRIPSREELPERLETVLQVVYLIYNEGYSATAGKDLTRPDLSGEAIRLGRLLVGSLTRPEAEAESLLALMLLQESRRKARTNEHGDLILLEDQDRRLWDTGMIAEGLNLARRAFGRGSPGPYALQAAIAAEHARVPRFGDTDWARIRLLYDALLSLHPSPVVALNRAVAVAMSEGPESGLLLVDEILKEGELNGYHLAHATRGDLCRRLGRIGEARNAYAQALKLAGLEPEIRFLRKRLKELEQNPPRSVETLGSRTTRRKGKP